MAASETIARVKNPDGLDFASLRKDVLGLAQNLSGKIWTDYNLHDPGVTIIEQLCFGLAELGYQADIGIAEYLSDDYGIIHYDQQVLYKPHDIFPNSAVTIKDYCKLFIDVVSDIDAIHMERASGQEGVFNISIKLRELLTAPIPTPEQMKERQKKIKSIVRLQYQQNRNLGEDVEHIVIEPTQACFLRGVIETNGQRLAPEILAEIFFQCARKISSDVRMDRYEDIYAANSDLNEIFMGPLTQHGYINEEYVVSSTHGKSVEELNGVIAGIEGVNKVYDLALVDDDGNTLPDTMIHGHSFFLQLPHEEHQLDFLVLKFNTGSSSGISPIASLNRDKQKNILSEAMRYLQRLEFEYTAFRSNKMNAANFYNVPEGVRREALIYYSVQHHFPGCYGINAEGLSSSASDERKTQAKQLKAYLYPSEQIMANFLQQLQDVKQLFAVNEVQPKSYFSQDLDNQHIPHIEECYVDDGKANVSLIQANYDNYIDRKNRALDTLLAIYGEQFPQEALSYFNGSHPANSDHWMIENKINYLKQLKNLGGERGKGFHQVMPQWNTDNISSLQKKMGIVLGLNDFSTSRSLTQEGAEGFHLLEHILLRPRVTAESDAQSTSDAFFDFTLSLIFPAGTARFSNPEFRQFTRHTLSEQLPAHLLPIVYWLDVPDMEEFEQRYQGWLDALSQYQKKLLEDDYIDPARLNLASGQLMEWLKAKEPAMEYWL